MSDNPALPPQNPSEFSVSDASLEDSLFGNERELSQLAARGGHDETATLGLFRRLRGPQDALRGGDLTALRDHLVMVHAPLVEHCARGFLASGEPLEDLLQEGYVGLIKAVDRFNPDKGIKFSTYSCHLIAGEIRHYLRDLGRLIHEPGWHFELRTKISRAADNLSQKLDRPATDEEIAAHLNIKIETVREVLERSQTLHVDSLDSLGANEENEGKLSVLERHDAERGGLRRGDEGRIDDRLFLAMALPQLKELEQQALTLFFFEELSKTDIARQLGISVNYVSYLVKRGTDQLRRILEAAPAQSGHTLSSPLSQQTARAAYLLELARGGAQSDPRRTFRPQARVPALTRPTVASLSQFALWLDEESARATRYGGEFSVLWCQLENWAAATKPLVAGERKSAGAAAAALVAGQCRDVDKVASLSSTDPLGLHFLVLLPTTGAAGQILGHRLLSKFASPLFEGFEAQLSVKVAYATFPGDGKTTDEIFAALGKQLGA